MTLLCSISFCHPNLFFVVFNDKRFWDLFDYSDDTIIVSALKGSFRGTAESITDHGGLTAQFLSTNTAKKRPLALNMSRAECGQRLPVLLERNWSLLIRPELTHKIYSLFTPKIDENKQDRRSHAILYVLVLMIVVFMVLCIVSSVMWYRRACDADMYRLQLILRFARRDRSKKKMKDSILKNRSPTINNKGIDIFETTSGRWDPERFDDMLENSQKVQDVIVDDIVHHMETEGDDDDDDNIDDGETSTSFMFEGSPTKA